MKIYQKACSLFLFSFMVCNLAHAAPGDPKNELSAPIVPTSPAANDAQISGLPGGFLFYKTSGATLGDYTQIINFAMAEGKTRKDYAPPRDPSKIVDTLAFCTTAEGTLQETLTNWKNDGFSANFIVTEDGTLYQWTNPLTEKPQCFESHNNNVVAVLAVGAPLYNEDKALIGYTLPGKGMATFTRITHYCKDLHIPLTHVADYTTLRGSGPKGTIINKGALEKATGLRWVKKESDQTVSAS